MPHEPLLSIPVTKQFSAGQKEYAPASEPDIGVGRSIDGFHQGHDGIAPGVDRIVNVNWETVKPPPRGTERESYLVAVTEVELIWGKIFMIVTYYSILQPH